MNDFANWIGEIHIKDKGVEVTRAITVHLAGRIRLGDAVILCSNPTSYASAFSKRWKGIIRKVENKRSSVAGGKVREEITSYLRELEAVKFVAGEVENRYTMTVWLLEPDEVGKLPPHVMTVYAMTGVTPEQLSFWADSMQDGGTIQTFRKSSFATIREELQ